MIYVENVKIEPDHSGRYHADASDLGLKVGEWPDKLSGLDAAGERFELRRNTRITHAGEFVGWSYNGPLGRFEVYND